VPGIVRWWCFHEAGVEPTLAGVVLGLLTAARPRRGVPVLGSVGFTVSLFITDFAFRGETIDDAKIGVLAASLLAAVVGTISVRWALRRPAVAPPGGEMT
jgi:Na+/H+ antiporter NhaA